jgi:hypothetical protein
VQSVVVSDTPLANVTTQVLLAKMLIPPPESLVTLFTGVPAKVASIRETLPNKNATIFLRKACRGTYCAACVDGSSICVSSVYVGVGLVGGGSYSSNVTLLERDIMYIVVPASVGDCIPQISNLSPEFVRGNALVISSSASVSTVQIVCSTDSSKAVNILVAV